MRILLCNFEYPPLGGGGGIVTAALARQLARRHDVTVLSSRALGLPATSLDGGVRVLRVRAPFRREQVAASLASMFGYLLSGFARAPRLFHYGEFDVVNTHFAVPTGPLGQWLANRLGVPNVLSLHGGDLFDPSKCLSPHRHWWLRRVVGSLLSRADRVVANSRDTAGHVAGIYRVARDVDVVQLGIERPPVVGFVPRAQFGLPADALVVTTIGRLVRRKQVDQLVKAVATSAVANAHLVVVGSGPEEAMIRVTARAHGMDGRVHCLGTLSELDKYRLLAVSDIFASTSRHEGFGLVFVEAMACGLPIVCYDAGGQTDFLATGETGHVVTLDDAAAFAVALRGLAASPERRRAIGEANRRRAEGLFIDCCAAGYEKVFEEAVAARRTVPSLVNTPHVRNRGPHWL